MVKRIIRNIGITVLVMLCSCRVLAFDIIAHRGASGYLPEHTLASTALAHAQHPDYIEQDVVLSRDGIPVVLHDIHLDTVTNVESVFPDRARDDGRFYVIDFTLSELRQLRVHEREHTDGRPVFPSRFQARDVHFGIATLAEHIALIQELNRLRDTRIGFYVEIKAPAWHKAQERDISRSTLDVLTRLNVIASDTPLIVQCFDLAEVKRLRFELDYKGTLMLLIGDNAWGESDTDYAHIRTPDGIRDIAGLVDGIGPWLEHLLPSSDRDKPVLPAWVATAQKKGLFIHPYTFRTDDLPAGLDANLLLKQLLEIYRVDGLFTDQVPPVRQFIRNNRD